MGRAGAMYGSVALTRGASIHHKRWNWGGIKNQSSDQTILKCDK